MKRIIVLLLVASVLAGLGYVNRRAVSGSPVGPAVTQSAAWLRRQAESVKAVVCRTAFYGAIKKGVADYQSLRQQRLAEEPKSTSARSLSAQAEQESAGAISTGGRIANGSASGKQGGEPGFPEREQMTARIDAIVRYAGASNVRHLLDGRTAYWDGASGAVVIVNTNSADADGGTAFKPKAGRKYFESLK